MWWMWGPPMWSGWWIFPIIAFIFMIMMLFACSRFLRGRGGFCGMRRDDDLQDLRGEIAELKEEISRLKASHQRRG